VNGIYKIEVRERAIVLVVISLWPFGDGGRGLGGLSFAALGVPGLLLQTLNFVLRSGFTSILGRELRSSLTSRWCL